MMLILQQLILSQNILRKKDLEQFEFISELDNDIAHFDFGQEYGLKYANQIQKNVYLDPLISKFKIWFSTPIGFQTYLNFLKNNTQYFENYIHEIRGLSFGSQVHFRDIFQTNMRQEFSYQLSPPAIQYSVDACSDVAICNDIYCILGHNEDGDQFNYQFNLLIKATFDKHSFVSFTYTGQIPSNAYGQNGNGVGYSVNWLGPNEQNDAGLGKIFLVRLLLDKDTKNYNDAINAIDEIGSKLCAGFNIQIYDINNRVILGMEIYGKGGFNSIHQINNPYFHANQYQQLNLDQHQKPSSVHRLNRWKDIKKPQDLLSLLNVLGDQKDKLYPIFHDYKSHKHGELSDWTISTFYVDIDLNQMFILDGNPKGNFINQGIDLNKIMVIKILQ